MMFTLTIILYDDRRINNNYSHMVYLIDNQSHDNAVY